MKAIFRISTLLCLTFLASCSYFSGKGQNMIQNKDVRYLTVNSTPPLKIPPGLQSDAFKTAYPIPERHYPEAKRDVDLTPPGLYN